jgi:hypothetical protein
MLIVASRFRHPHSSHAFAITFSIYILGYLDFTSDAQVSNTNYVLHNCSMVYAVGS